MTALVKLITKCTFNNSQPSDFKGDVTKYIVEDS